MPRLKSLHIKNFRSISGVVDVQLDAPIVLIHGPNGAGKTSLLAGLELALTGEIPSLSRADPEYLKFLPHRGCEFGEVRVEIIDDDQTIRTGHMKVNGFSAIGTPALNKAEIKFFNERAYLAQLTLGRLLEIYQHGDKKSASPLTIFVNELLGLDRLEALIDGLHSAGHVGRLKDPVPSYQRVRDQIPAQEAVLEALRTDQREIDEQIKALELQLRERLAEIDPNLRGRTSDLTVHAIELTTDLEEPALVDLVRLRREVEATEASWAELDADPVSQDVLKLENAKNASEAALNAWRQLNEASVSALLDQAASFFADVAASGESRFAARASSLLARIQPDSDRVQLVLSGHEETLKQRDQFDQQIQEARTRITRLDEQIATIADTNEALAKVLSELTSHIHNETCPVCDRNFGEVSTTPLSAHVAAKISQMVEQAGQLQALSRDRATTNGAIGQLERQRTAVAAQLLGDAELNSLKSRSADLQDVALKLGQMTAVMHEGDRLRDEAVRTATAVLNAQKADQSIEALRSSLQALASRIGGSTDDQQSFRELLDRLKSVLQEREAALTARQSARRSAVELVNLLTGLRERIGTLPAQQRAAEDLLQQLNQQKDDADSIIELGRDLLKRAREARAQVVRRVFNDKLNALWRDLFIRLAPEEPFIPAFAIPDTASAEIHAVLETLYRRGGKGGNPRAMLSAGNLNTAALTLFLALHLSVRAELPWLVIDDPVQSMDEVHIAQFAALLRTLSKQTTRQVVIAVHERSLFDYLTLELSPAFAGDRLNVIELSRSAAGETLSRWNPIVYVPDKAIAV
jgi:exonuclease SbcC